MKAIAKLIIIILITGWTLSTQESHFCRDDSSFSETEHQMEMCHFGHCSHVLRIVRVAPEDVVFAFTFVLPTPYTSSRYERVQKLHLRPPARALLLTTA